MSLHTVDILPILLRTTGLLAFSVLADPRCRAAYALVLVQGILIVRLSVPVPWGGRMLMIAPPASSSQSRDESTAFLDRRPPATLAR